MKSRFILFLLTISLSLLINTVEAQSPTKAFYQTHKKKEGVFNMKIPGWLIWFGGGMLYNSINDPDAKVFMKLAKRIKNFRLMVSEHGSPVSDEEMEVFVQDIRQKDFEELIFVKDDGSTVNVIGRTKNKKLKDLLLMVQDDGEFIYMSMKTNIKAKHINEIIQHFVSEVPALKETSKKRKEERAERRKKRRLKKLPQA